MVIGVKFCFCLGGSYLVTRREGGGVRGMRPERFLKFGALKLHFQHSENTFGEIFYIFRTRFHWCIL